MYKETVAPVLVLGVGNLLFGDDGVGIELLDLLSSQCGDWDGSVEFLDGGTRGLALLPAISGRSALILLDAACLGGSPGTIYVRRDEEVLDLRHRSCTAHEGNAGEILAMALLLGELPERIFMIGIEPLRLSTGIELSKPVRDAIPAALEAACHALQTALDVPEAAFHCGAFLSRRNPAEALPAHQL